MGSPKKDKTCHSEQRFLISAHLGMIGFGPPLWDCSKSWRLHTLLLPTKRAADWLTDWLVGRLSRTEDERASQFAPGRSLHAAPLFGHRTYRDGHHESGHNLGFIDIGFTGMLFIFVAIFWSTAVNKSVYWSVSELLLSPWIQKWTNIWLLLVIDAFAVKCSY